MKDAFENSFKESLDNFEMPYDGAAWSAMQSRLDTSASTPSFEDSMKDGLNANQYPYNPAAWTALSSRLDKGAKGGFKKWYIAAGIIGAAAVTSLLIWNATPEDKTPLKQSSSNQKAITSSKDSSTSTSKTQGTIQNNLKVANNSNASTTDLTGSDRNSNKSNIISSPSSINNATQTGNQHTTTTTTTIPNTNPTNNGSNTNPAQTTTVAEGSGDNTLLPFITPAIPEMVCEGSSIQIQNDNDYPLLVVYPNGLNWVGRENQVTRLNPSIAGLYEVGYIDNNTFKKKSSFVVSEAPVADFDYVDISQKYLDGLPTIEVRSTTKESSYIWDYQNGSLLGEQIGLHFYEKGLHPVKLKVTSENGCSSTIEKTVSVDEDYNLLAMNAFFPNGNDRETNRFMPYALTERKVNFRMIILDPNDGHVMFETSDASNGWNGIDQQNGSQAPMGKSYIWKVSIANPQRGESSNYTGTILTLQQ